MPGRTNGATQKRAAYRALARAGLYRLLSQGLAFPSRNVIDALQRLDLPQALEFSPFLTSRTAGALSTFAEEGRIEPEPLAREHRRVFSHVMAADCPPCETVYTAQHIFEETRELSDLAGFYRAFGLGLVERERPDHISVELEFMHLLTFKEAYARVHHPRAKARVCRDAQRAFVRDHLGCWAQPFAALLRAKAGSGYYRAVADLLDAFITSEVALLRVQPDVPNANPDRLQRTGEDDPGCPFAEACAVAEIGAEHGPAGSR